MKLAPTAGEVIADAIATEHFSAVIDLTLFRKGEALRFMAAFLETLYRKNRSALHLFIDEADVVAPQKPFGPDEARVLGACEDIVRRGRIRGIGCTLITQRPQVLNKNVLSQVDMLTALGMNHPKDIAAIKEWVAVHGDESQAKQMFGPNPKWTGPRIDWVIAGCESGPGARPCSVEWLRSLRDQCSAASVPFFLKQAAESDMGNCGDADNPNGDDPCGEPVRYYVHGPKDSAVSCGCTVEGAEDANGCPPLGAGEGSKRKGGGVLELPYLDGVQHAAFPEAR